MTFLEALYGSQYYELQQKGRDGNKAKLGANLFLSALIILGLFAVIMICVKFVPDFNDKFTRSLRNIFGYTSGKNIGKLLAIPLIALIYFIIGKTTGSQHNFKSKVETFMQLPDEVKKKANAKLFIPFFILLAIVTGLAMWG